MGRRAGFDECKGAFPAHDKYASACHAPDIVVNTCVAPVAPSQRSVRACCGPAGSDSTQAALWLLATFLVRVTRLPVKPPWSSLNVSENPNRCHMTCEGSCVRRGNAQVTRSRAPARPRGRQKSAQSPTSCSCFAAGPPQRRRGRGSSSGPAPWRSRERRRVKLRIQAAVAEVPTHQHPGGVAGVRSVRARVVHSESATRKRYLCGDRGRKTVAGNGLSYASGELLLLPSTPAGALTRS